MMVLMVDRASDRVWQKSAGVERAETFGKTGPHSAIAAVGAIA